MALPERLSSDTAEVHDTAISAIEGDFETLGTTPCAVDEKAAAAIDAAHVPEATVADPPFPFAAGDGPAVVEVGSDIDIDGDGMRRCRNDKRCCKQAEDKSECRGCAFGQCMLLRDRWKRRKVLQRCCLRFLGGLSGFERSHAARSSVAISLHARNQSGGQSSGEALKLAQTAAVVATLSGTRLQTSHQVNSPRSRLRMPLNGLL